MIYENILPQANYFLQVSQNIAFSAENSNAYLFPLEEIINPLNFLDTNPEEYLGHIIMHFVILNEPCKCSNTPRNANSLKSILTSGNGEVKYIQLKYP